MVKEFQQLRQQMTQLLLKQQQQQQEMTAFKAGITKDKEEIFLDVIELIEQLARREELGEQTLQLEHTPKYTLPEIYNNIKKDLIQLLVKNGVQPIAEHLGFDELPKTQNKGNLDQARLSRKRYSYQGKILKKDTTIS